MLQLRFWITLTLIVKIKCITNTTIAEPTVTPSQCQPHDIQRAINIVRQTFINQIIAMSLDDSMPRFKKSIDRLELSIHSIQPIGAHRSDLFRMAMRAQYLMSFDQHVAKKQRCYDINHQFIYSMQTFKSQRSCNILQSPFCRPAPSSNLLSAHTRQAHKTIRNLIEFKVTTKEASQPASLLIQLAPLNDVMVNCFTSNFHFPFDKSKCRIQVEWNGIEMPANKSEYPEINCDFATTLSKTIINFNLWGVESCSVNQIVPHPHRASLIIVYEFIVHRLTTVKHVTQYILPTLLLNLIAPIVHLNKQKDPMHTGIKLLMAQIFWLRHLFSLSSMHYADTAALIYYHELCIIVHTLGLTFFCGIESKLNSDRAISRWRTRAWRIELLLQCAAVCALILVLLFVDQKNETYLA